jgi:hypothetical protein
MIDADLQVGSAPSAALKIFGFAKIKPKRTIARNAELQNRQWLILFTDEWDSPVAQYEDQASKHLSPEIHIQLPDYRHRQH